MDSLWNPASTVARILLALVVLGLQAEACPPGSTSTACGSCGTVSSCQQPVIPQQPCGVPQQPYGGCQQGSACGRYGCYNVKRNKLAVKSARTEEVFGFGQHGPKQRSQQQAPSFGRAADTGAKALLETHGLVSFSAKTEPKIQLEEPLGPDERFMRCCIGRKLPDACLTHCNFATYTKAALTRMYMKQDACPIYAAAEIHFCAAQGQDHRQCCTQTGVTTTLAGQQCLVFCDQRPGKITNIDITYMACFDRFETMKACFWRGMGEQIKRQLHLF